MTASVYKTSLAEVFSDDTSTPFWQQIQAHPGYRELLEVIDKNMSNTGRTWDGANWTEHNTLFYGKSHNDSTS